jgi:Flp pilus assembly pilin Flp
MRIRQLSHFPKLLRRLAGNRRGATAIEYTVLAATISVAAIIGLNTIGQKIQNVLGFVNNALP